MKTYLKASLPISFKLFTPPLLLLVYLTSSAWAGRGEQHQRVLTDYEQTVKLAVTKSQEYDQIQHENRDERKKARIAEKRIEEIHAGMNKALKSWNPHSGKSFRYDYKVPLSSEYASVIAQIYQTIGETYSHHYSVKLKVQGTGFMNIGLQQLGFYYPEAIPEVDWNDQTDSQTQLVLKRGTDRLLSTLFGIGFGSNRVHILIKSKTTRQQ